MGAANFVNRVFELPLIFECEFSFLLLWFEYNCAVELGTIAYQLL